jgi:uncharacterized protein HemY
MKITLQIGVALLLALIGFVAMAAVYSSRVVGVYDSYQSASPVSGSVLIFALGFAVVFALAFAIYAWIDMQGKAE